MPSNDLPTDPISLSKMIEDDIRHRGLRTGDRYLTAKDAGEQFKVSTVTAHRAFVILTDKEVVIRKRKSGTYIGPGFITGEKEKTNDKLQSIHVIMDKIYRKSFPNMFELFNEVMETELPETAFQMHIVPDDDYNYCQKIIHQIKESPAPEAVILIRSSERVQNLVQESKIPAIIYGSPYSGIQLPFLDIDQKMIGRLITEKLLQEDCRHFILLQNNYWRRGDTDLFNEISTVLGDNQLPMGSLEVHNVSNRGILPVEELKNAISKYSQDKIGIICRSHSISNEIQLHLHESYPDIKIEIASCDYLTELKDSQIIQVKPNFNQKDQITLLLKSLSEYTYKHQNLLQELIKVQLSS